MDYLEEMDKLLETYNLPQSNQEEMENSSRSTVNDWKHFLQRWDKPRMSTLSIYIQHILEILARELRQEKQKEFKLQVKK